MELPVRCRNPLIVLRYLLRVHNICDLQQLVFALSAVSTASGRVFGRPLQAKKHCPMSLELHTNEERYSFNRHNAPHTSFNNNVRPISGSDFIGHQTLCISCASRQYLVGRRGFTTVAAASKSTMSPSTSFSARISSFSTVSLALSISSFSLGSDDEGYNSSTFQSSLKKKKLSRRKRSNKSSSNGAFGSTRVDQ